MHKQKVFILILCLFFQRKSAKKLKECDDKTTETTGGTAYWKYRGDQYTSSEDLICWKEDLNIVLRECNTTSGQWQPESVECTVQNQTNKYCPEELIEVKNENGNSFCLKISRAPEKYNESFCYGSKVILALDYSELQTSSFRQAMYDQSIFKFWLPIKRESSSMPFKVRLPGERWGQIIEEEITDIRSTKNCMSTRIEQHKKMHKPELIATDCDDLLHTVCVFKGELTASSGCPDGLGALSYRPNECYGINWEGILTGQQKEVRLKEYFRQRNTFKMVLKNILPKIKEMKYFQIDNFFDKSSKQFSILMNKNEVLRIVENDNQAFPVMYKETIKMQENFVQLVLKFDIIFHELILIVYNGEFLWRANSNDYGIQCFTNADYEIQRNSKIDIIWENSAKTKSIFKLKLVKENPGEYWCEGHTFDYKFVTTERVEAAKKKRGHFFAVRVNVTCIIENKNVCENSFKYTKNLGKKVQEIFKERSRSISQKLVIHSARIMSIEQIFSTTIDCWIHLSASLKNFAVVNSDEDNSEQSKSLENQESKRHDTLVRMQIGTLLQELILLENPESVNFIHSLEYCFPNTIRLEANKIYHWKETVRGQVGSLSGLCIQSNGLPYTRRCNGNFIHGAFWESAQVNISCQLAEKNLLITKALYSLESSKLIKVSPEKIVREVKSILEVSSKNLLPVDLDFTANILQTSIKYFDQSTLSMSTRFDVKFWKEATLDLIAIYNYLANVDKKTIRMSVKLNSTNKLLEAFESGINTLSSHTNLDNKTVIRNVSYDVEQDIDFESLEYEDVGVSVKISTNLLLFIINPLIANITGIAMLKNKNDSDGPLFLKGPFKNEHYRFLQSNHEVEDFIYEPNLQFGTYLPEKLLSQLDTIPNASNYSQETNCIVVIKVYSNDNLFQTKGNHNLLAALGRVVSISLPGHSSHLPINMPLVFRAHQSSPSSHSKTTKMCSYWNYKKWASDGIHVSNMFSNTTNDFVFCQVSHLTPFAYLVGVNFTVEEAIEVDVNHTNHVHALDIITIVGCSLSLFGICGIFITAAIFNSWRQKPSSKVLLQLSAAIALQMIILCFVNTQKHAIHLIIHRFVPSCVAIGALLHYSVLVQFFWMMVIAYLQFKRYVQVIGRNRPSRFFIKSALFCWGMPVIPVVLVVVLDHDSFSRGTICYPSGYALYFGIILPILIILIANFVIFCLIIYNILVSRSLPARHMEKHILIYQIRLSVLLFFLMGFTWCFGILSTIKGGMVFSYFFCLTATLQGFVIFIYFIILDPLTRGMWFVFFSNCCSIDKSFLQRSVKETTETC